MGRRQGMTLEERQRAIGMLHAGMTARAVARHFNRHESTISRLRNRLGGQDKSTTDPDQADHGKQRHAKTVTSRRFLDVTG